MVPRSQFGCPIWCWNTGFCLARRLWSYCTCNTTGKAHIRICFRYRLKTDSPRRISCNMEPFSASVIPGWYYHYILYLCKTPCYWYQDLHYGQFNGLLRVTALHTTQSQTRGVWPAGIHRLFLLLVRTTIWVQKAERLVVAINYLPLRLNCLSAIRFRGGDSAGELLHTLRIPPWPPSAV